MAPNDLGIKDNAQVRVVSADVGGGKVQDLIQVSLGGSEAFFYNMPCKGRAYLRVSKEDLEGVREIIDCCLNGTSSGKEGSYRYGTITVVDEKEAGLVSRLLKNQGTVSPEETQEFLSGCVSGLDDAYAALSRSE
ncbi:MAG TPA: hypothetical protein ENH99_00180 [Candidatus Pacearchaeota archaeon]|nr:hypothetical protein [Candidatus Pacearchaeota archaeon]